jgi:ParB family chromosome partitioning protein
LRIDIVEAPSNDRDIYLSSWRINKERSTQTPLDDSIRFKMLLGEAIFESQDQLAESLGMSKSGVSKVLALNAIPERVMRRLKDTNIPGSIKALYAISKLFPENIDTNPDALEKAETMAFDIIEDAVKKELSGNQVEALVEAKQKGPAVRVRNEVRHVAHGALKGTIKFNQEKGRLDFNVTGLSAERVTELREKVEAWCKEGIGE